nr:hornerin-like [Dasypus novemcinctus]
MPKLLQSLITVIDVFYQYATEDGECDMLNKAELKELLENEFYQILKNPDDPHTVDVIMQSLDRDHNKKVDFTEYLLMLFKLIQASVDNVVMDLVNILAMSKKNYKGDVVQVQVEFMMSAVDPK